MARMTAARHRGRRGRPGRKSGKDAAAGKRRTRADARVGARRRPDAEGSIVVLAFHGARRPPNPDSPDTAS